MKRIVLIVALAICSAAAFSQKPSTFYTGITIGGKNVANKVPITKVTGTGNKAILYSETTPLSIVNPDSTEYKTFGVYKRDSVNPKPGSYTTRYDFKYEFIGRDGQKLIRALGATFKLGPVWNWDFSISTSLSDGVIYGALYYTPDTLTISGARFIQTISGVYTGDSYNGIALYSISGTTLTKVTETSNAAAFWTNTADSPVDKPFPYPVTIYPGFYSVACVYNNSAQTTAPTIFKASSIGYSINSMLTNKICWNISAPQATLPATINGATTNTNGDIRGILLY